MAREPVAALAVALLAVVAPAPRLAARPLPLRVALPLALDCDRGLDVEEAILGRLPEPFLELPPELPDARFLKTEANEHRQKTKQTNHHPTSS